MGHGAQERPVAPFAIASVLLFIRFMEGQGSRSGRWWFASFGCFLAALLSKTTAVFVPPCLVMIMLWQRRRVDGRAWRSLSPFFAAGLALGLFTAHMEKTHVGATGDDFALGLLDRLQLAGQVSTFYLRKFFVPDEQVFIYRRFDVDASNLVAWWPAIACGALLIAAAARWTRNRGPLLIALWIGAALFPALGFFDVWPFRYSYVADHFAYAAMPALALTGVIVAMKLGERLKAGVRVGVATGWSAVLVCTALALLATPKYESEEVLWRTTFAQNPTAWIAANNIASIRLAEAGALVARGETAGVEERAREALAFASAAGELKPDEFTNAVNRSEAHRLLGQKEGALREIETVTTLAPRLSEVHWMRGRALEALGRIDEARGAFTQAASLAATPSEEIEARRDLMRIAVARSELPDALRECERMVELDPSNPDTTANLGSLLLATGKRGEARAALLRALSMPPNQFSAPSVWVTTSVAYLKLAIDSDLGDGERRAARAVANRLAALSQGDPMARYLRAALEFAAGDPAAAGELESLSAQARGTGNTLLEQEIDRFLKSRSR